ncbi:MAG: 2-phosphosulfolactate phosphatase [bacterium]|nr:2-phosphosulfolactate phosphatase [bacterium]MBK8130049.1 2-phosphosulfolactate phosphatase [bacterium]
MNLRVYPTPREWNEDDVRGCVAIVIDVLRASSTITQALVNGARDIVPVATPAEAGELAVKAGRGDVVLGGERDGKLIEGFDLGNSPFEYSPDRVGGRTIIFASTNGSPSLVRAKTAEHVLVGSFNNQNAVVTRARDIGLDVVVICSGRNGKFSLEDFVCAGKLVDGLLPGGTIGNDGAHAALDLFKYYRSQISEVVKGSYHGKYLAGLGFEADLEHCARVDIHQIVPALIEGKIKVPKLNGGS